MKRQGQPGQNGLGGRLRHPPLLSHPGQDEFSGFYQVGSLTDFHDETAQRRRFRYQFWGHDHTNKVIREKSVLLYEPIPMMVWP